MAKKKIVTNIPFSEGDRVQHKLFGLGTVCEIHRTGSGNWSTYVEFDSSHEKISYGGGRFAAIVSTYLELVESEPEPESKEAEESLELSDDLEVVKCNVG